MMREVNLFLVERCSDLGLSINRFFGGELPRKVEKQSKKEIDKYGNLAGKLEGKK
jgi:hypothetical protein